jgi:hypothetical protein
MIVFDLECRAGPHRFEGWFASSEEFAAQQARGLVSCPQCGSADVIKAPMAPHLTRKGNQRREVPAPTAIRPAPSVPAGPAPAAQSSGKPAAQPTAPPPEAIAMMRAIAVAQAEALKSSRWVGKKFAEDARAMHYGDAEVAPIHGQATPEEAQALVEEGIEVAPILFPIAPPGEVN